MRVDVQLNDDELALLSGYSRSTSMGIKKPGELQRELLSDMENIEEKRMVSVPEVENASGDADDVAEAGKNDAPVGVRADFLSMLSELAKPDANKAGNDEDEDGYEDDEDDDDDDGILPDDEDEEIDGADGVTLPDDDEGEEGNGESLPDDDDEEDDGDEDDGQDGVLPDDDEEDFQDGVLPDDDEEDSQGIASEEEITGIPLEDEGNSEELSEDEDEGDSELPEDEDEGDSELPEDEDDGDSELPEDEDDGDSGELPEDEDEELSEDEDEGDYELPEDEDEDDYDSEELPADEDEGASGELPEDDVEGVPESTEEYIDSTPSRIAPVVAEKPASPVRRVQKVVRPVSKQSVGRPAGYSTPPASLYDFILSNGGSMLIEDVKKYYPIDEVKKALNLGKIYRFGNKVGV